MVITRSHKFVVPDAGQMTNGMLFDDLKDVLKLPFPEIALLREIDIGGRKAQQICLAFEASPEDDAEFFVFDITRYPDGSNMWAPCRPVGVVIPRDKSGVVMVDIDFGIKEEEKIYGHALERGGEGYGGMNGLAELLLMLSLKNVATKEIAPSQKLNKKRAENGKLPLYSYHVLLIDGKETHCERGGESDRAIRSHYRRGHIRRLDDDRRIWVRSTIVKGRAPGFIDKEYATRH